MRLIKLWGRERSADDWVLWCILWSCTGLLAGGMSVLVALALSVPQ